MEKGKEGRLGRKSLKSQGSSEKVLSRLMGRVVYKGYLLEKSHVGQEWSDSKTPILLAQWLKVTLVKLVTQWIQRNSIWGCCP